MAGGRAWQGGHAWQGACMARGACVAGETATAAGGTHPTGMHSCLYRMIDAYLRRVIFTFVQGLKYFFTFLGN